MDGGSGNHLRIGAGGTQRVFASDAFTFPQSGAVLWQIRRLRA